MTSDQTKPSTDDAALWTAAEAAAAVGARAPALSWTASAVEIDSREVKPGALFVALAGAETDGHRFLDAALASGAAALLVSDLNAVPEGSPALLVPDTLRGLEALGAAARVRAVQMTAIGVTGSVGKTSTKEMLAAMLSPQGPTHAPVKSFNNHVGVPLTLARTPAPTRYGVYEMGMNHAGEIAPLSRLVRPDIALITAVEAVHIGNFADGIQGVAAAKAEIFAGLRAGGVAILRRDAHFEYLSAEARSCGAGDVLDFGPEAKAARLLSATVEGEKTRVEAEILGARRVFDIGAPGLHFAANALGALLAVARAGADVDAALEALSAWCAVSGRGDRATLRLATGGDILLVDESYNANPASMRAAIAAFAALQPDGPAGRRHLFVTDMLELGAHAAKMHADLAEAPGLDAIDVVHAAGPEMKAFHAAVPVRQRGLWAEDAEALAKSAPTVLEAGDAVMVKGSLGSRARLIAAAIRALGSDKDDER